MKYTLHATLLPTLLLLSGCGGGGSGETTSDTSAPVFTSSVTVNVAENQTNVMAITATDNSTVSYTISGGTDSSKFSINSSSGLLVFTSAPDYENPADAGADNIYNVTLMATDTSGNAAEQAMIITVTDVLDETGVDMTSAYSVKRLGTATSIHTEVDLGSTPKSLYVLLSNYSETSSASTTITHDKISSAPQQKEIAISPLSDKPQILRAPQDIQQFNANANTLLQKTDIQSSQKLLDTIPEKRSDTVGSSQLFYLELTSSGDSTLATARKVISGISTPLGNKMLNVWVSNDAFDSGSGCSKARCVTQAMVDELAAFFLAAGTENDIYDWVTNIYGEEWGSHPYPTQLIAPNDEITILLTDIDNDNSPNGGVIGYFWAKDNFKTTEYSGSNQRVMFYIDSVMFANGTDGWDIDDFWPKEMISTLAHEFQHMIHFYQKNVLLDTSTDVWLEEMLSESTEDLVATKIRHIGPRGVDYLDGSAGDPNNTDGRYPYFNELNYLTLTAWNSTLYDYSKVNAFGAYLLRNYGGAKVLHDIMHNTYNDERAVVYAVNQTTEGSGKTFNDLLREWGVGVLLSSRTDLIDTPSYNTGDFTYDTYDAITYELGSINFFNYLPQPKLFTTAGTVNPQANYYYKVGDNLTGTVTIDLTLNGTTEATLVAKE